MAIKKWRPLHDLEQFLESLPSTNSKGFDLAMDISQDDKNVYVVMQVPGVNSENITIDLDDNYLKISGFRQEKKEHKSKDFFRKEIKRGEFSRIVELPWHIKKNAVDSQVKDGILSITLPKAIAKKEKIKKENDS